MYQLRPDGHPSVDSPNGALRAVSVSVVIPTLNEAKNLPHILPRLPDEVDEVIIVDGASADDTVDVARRLRPDVRIVHQRGRGKGAALATGFSAATGEVIVTLDADGSTDPEEIPRFVHALLDGADYVKGSRFLDGGGSTDITALRRVGNWMLTQLVNVLFGTRYSDLCYGFNALWSRHRHVAANVPGFEVETAMNVRAAKSKLDVVEVPSMEGSRIFGASNLNAARDGWRVLRTILRERFSRATYDALARERALEGALARSAAEERVAA